MPGHPTPGPIDAVKDGKMEEKTAVQDGDAKASSPLRQVDVKIVSQEVCKRQYAPYAGPPYNFKITDDMICGYNLGKDRYENSKTFEKILQSKTNL